MFALGPDEKRLPNASPEVEAFVAATGAGLGVADALVGKPREAPDTPEVFELVRE